MPGCLYGLVRDTFEQNYSLTAIGRLRQGVSLGQARAELGTLSRSMRETWPAARLSELAAFPLQDDIVARAREPLRLLSIAALLVLLIVCVNVANLSLVRATGRTSEFAIAPHLAPAGAV